MLLDRTPLEGEPDGSATGAEAPAEIVTPAPPVVADPASEAADGAPDEAAPAGDQLPGEAIDQPAGLSDEDWAALREAHPDKFAPPVKTEPPPEKVRGQDPFYRMVQTEGVNAAKAREAFASKLAQATDGDGTVTLEDVHGAIAGAESEVAWRNAEERRGQITVNRAVFEREVLGVEDSKLDLGNPLHKEFDELLTDLETAQQNAARERGRIVREYDPKKRADHALRADIMDAHAVGNFYRKTLDLALEEGKKRAGADLDARATTIATKARTNGQTEAIAKAKATLQGAAAMSTATTPGETSKHYSWAEIQKMDKKQLDALPEGVWERAMNEG